ncbi:MAG: DUF523 domain-containing protein [Desulfobacteraceae bacterium]|nr:DUF523 domain-containing protein [Desulfobacteraceae bacterium]
MEKILISACLAGDLVRYDNQRKPLDPTVLEQLEANALLVKACPEVAGGLPVPRPPAEIVNGSGEDVLNGGARILNALGEDVTQAFKKGAERILNIIHKYGIKYALLKEKSPSCGSHFIYSGTFEKKLISGRGITTALLASNNVSIFSENEIEDLFILLNRNSDRGKLLKSSK